MQAGESGVSDDVVISEGTSLSCSKAVNASWVHTSTFDLYIGAGFQAIFNVSAAEWPEVFHSNYVRFDVVLVTSGGDGFGPWTYLKLEALALFLYNNAASPWISGSFDED